jgi:hypothetical protein
VYPDPDRIMSLKFKIKNVFYEMEIGISVQGGFWTSVKNLVFPNPTGYML